MAAKNKPWATRINQAFALRPLVDGERAHLCFIEPMDIYQRHWEWDARRLMNATGLRALEPVFLDMPPDTHVSIAHILARLPEEKTREACAFRMSRSYEIWGAGFEGIIVYLYAGQLPPEVAGQPVIAKGKTFTAPLPENTGLALDAVTLQQELKVKKPVRFRKPPPSL